MRAYQNLLNKILSQVPVATQQVRETKQAAAANGHVLLERFLHSTLPSRLPLASLPPVYRDAVGVRFVHVRPQAMATVVDVHRTLD
jgi:hypothetical protein